jgi:hypothetical protein
LWLAAWRAGRRRSVRVRGRDPCQDYSLWEGWWKGDSGAQRQMMLDANQMTRHLTLLWSSIRFARFVSRRAGTRGVRRIG